MKGNDLIGKKFVFSDIWVLLYRFVILYFSTVSMVLCVFINLTATFYFIWYKIVKKIV